MLDWLEPVQLQYGEVTTNVTPKKRKGKKKDKKSQTPNRFGFYQRGGKDG